jgi:uncharacterized protein YndB with AHSA1/START domain
VTPPTPEAPILARPLSQGWAHRPQSNDRAAEYGLNRHCTGSAPAAYCFYFRSLDLERELTELRFERFIRADAEHVFALLADLRDYDRWLPRSPAFHGTSKISEGPIRVGTTYVEESPFGVRYGTVTGLKRPTILNFEQPMRHKSAMFGEIGIKLFHVLTPQPAGVHVLRRLELTPKGPVTLFMPLVTKAFRDENERMMTTLQTFAEAEADY